jgi:hypothetical protein
MHRPRFAVLEKGEVKGLGCRNRVANARKVDFMFRSLDLGPSSSSGSTRVSEHEHAYAQLMGGKAVKEWEQRAYSTDHDISFSDHHLSQDGSGYSGGIGDQQIGHIDEEDFHENDFSEIGRTGP